jgi:hypothetical protein
MLLANFGTIFPIYPQALWRVKCGYPVERTYARLILAVVGGLEKLDQRRF